VAEVRTSDILDKAAQLVAEGGKDLIFVLDRLFKRVSRGH
jgi:hypothetical protein